MARIDSPRTLAVILVAFAAGAAGAVFANASSRWLLPNADAATAPAEAVIARRIDLVDGTGRVRAQLAVAADGASGLFFFDTAGRNRLVLGTYSKAENEYPTIVLNDTQQHAAGIFRLFGSKETPVVVFKHDGQDRSIYGLNPASTEPFLVRYSNTGSKDRTFGDF
ncbi:MAG TPA: hypothetical protein VMG60_00460 [Burkholderiaceae bacterium]|nr:hypothetical protein [Burkholderiaceae bacterium]